MSDFAYTVVASSLHDAATVDRLIGPVRSALAKLGGERTDDPTSGTDAPHLVVVATGGTEQAVIDVVRRRRAVAGREPVVLVAHAFHNSLPASLEALARLRSDGISGRIVQAATPGDLEATVGDLVTLHSLDGARLGLVGPPSEWLVASVPDRDELRRRWGIELVDVDIGGAIGRYRSLPGDAAVPVAVKFGAGERPSGDRPSRDLVAAAGLHPVLVDTIAAADVDAVAVRCFDFITEIETSGCVALAELNDTGVVAGCEGDVASTVAMMLIRSLLGRPSWIANPASIDVESNELLLAHCTVAPSMVEDLELHTHFESGLGIGLRGRFPLGWVTLVRLGGRGLGRRWIAEAELIRSESSPDLCRTQARLRVADQQVGAILEDPLGNHLVMVVGRHRDRLERWCRLAID